MKDFLKETILPVVGIAFTAGFVAGFSLFAWACFTSIKP